MKPRTLALASLLAVAAAPRLGRADDPDASASDAAVDASADASTVAAPVATPPTPISTVAATPPTPTPSAAPVRRHRRRAHRRRHGSRALLRNRGSVVSIGWRYTNIPTEGLSGPTHGVSLDVMPLARMRGPARYVRLDVGGEFAARFARAGATDTISWLRLGLGAQYPTRWVTPFVMLVGWGGFATRYRFFETLLDGAWTMGLEGGADLRLVGFAGVTASVGVGRTTIGEQWSWGGWFHAGIALF